MGDPPAVMTHPRDRLSQICSRSEAEWDLAEAALLVAAAEYPGLDPRDGLRKLDELGNRARAFLKSKEPRGRALELAHLLHEVEGFDGNREEYEDPRNSFLNDVLERRKGLPILLSLVYCEVGRRAGVPLAGIGMPGRFIVEVTGASGFFLDPFDGGRLLSVEECARAVGEMYHGEPAFSMEMLRQATPRETLARILRNLMGVYRSRKDSSRSWRVADLLLVVAPDAPDGLETFRSARRDLASLN
jgi:regulator of sirC expression with transglutaminase-like and TPR domain